MDTCCCKDKITKLEEAYELLKVQVQTAERNQQLWRNVVRELIIDKFGYDIENAPAFERKKNNCTQAGQNTLNSGTSYATSSLSEGNNFAIQNSSSKPLVLKLVKLNKELIHPKVIKKRKTNEELPSKSTDNDMLHNSALKNKDTVMTVSINKAISHNSSQRGNDSLGEDNWDKNILESDSKENLKRMHEPIQMNGIGHKERKHNDNWYAKQKFVCQTVPRQDHIQNMEISGSYETKNGTTNDVGSEVIDMLLNDESTFEDTESSNEETYKLFERSTINKSVGVETENTNSLTRPAVIVSNLDISNSSEKIALPVSSPALPSSYSDSGRSFATENIGYFISSKSKSSCQQDRVEAYPITNTATKRKSPFLQNIVKKRSSPDRESNTSMPLLQDETRNNPVISDSQSDNANDDGWQKFPSSPILENDNFSEIANKTVKDCLLNQSSTSATNIYHLATSRITNTRGCSYSELETPKMIINIGDAKSFKHMYNCQRSFGIKRETIEIETIELDSDSSDDTHELYTDNDPPTALNSENWTTDSSDGMSQDTTESDNSKEISDSTKKEVMEMFSSSEFVIKALRNRVFVTKLIRSAVASWEKDTVLPPDKRIVPIKTKSAKNFIVLEADKNTYFCTICNLSLSDNYDRAINHGATHFIKGSCKCGVCGFKSPSSAKFIEHLKSVEFIECIQQIACNIYDKNDFKSKSLNRRKRTKIKSVDLKDLINCSKLKCKAVVKIIRCPQTDEFCRQYAALMSRLKAIGYPLPEEISNLTV